MYACMHACMHVCTCVCVYACMYVWMYVYICIYIYTCLCVIQQYIVLGMCNPTNHGNCGIEQPNMNKTDGTDKDMCGGFLSHGVSPYFHPFLDGIFSVNHQFLGTSHFRKPPSCTVHRTSRTPWRLAIAWRKHRWAKATGKRLPRRLTKLCFYWKAGLDGFGWWG